MTRPWNMRPSAQVRTQEFDFEHFIDHVFTKYIDAFIKEIIDAFLQLKFWPVFDIYECNRNLKLQKPRNNSIN